MSSELAQLTGHDCAAEGCAAPDYECRCNDHLHVLGSFEGCTGEEAPDATPAKEPGA